MSPDPIGASEPLIYEGPSPEGVIGHRFRIVAVACQRVTQLRNGSRPRLDPGGHKPCVAAVAEVIAGAVPYYLS